MTQRRHLRAFVLAAIVALSLLAAPGAAQAVEGDIQIKQLYAEPKDSTDPVRDPPSLPYPATQAGGHPDMRILFRLCEPEGGDPHTTKKGCGREHLFSTLKHFTLHLPPGMLGNPTQVMPCPTHLFYAASCPQASQVGFSLTDGVQGEAADNGPLLNVPTPIYNVATIGLEPARLGTGAPLPTDPPGPLPIIVTLRTADSPGHTADFGIDSTINEVPFKLGAFGAKAAQFDTLLCGEAPCTGGFTSPAQPRYVWVAPLAGAKPFFRNPTSCKPATMRMDAISYKTPLNTVSESSDVRQTRDPVTKVVTTTRTPAFSPTGCEDVPFDLDVTTTPDTTQAGAPTGMSVELKYPEYANDPIWQAQLKDADVTLPEGVTLGPAGGVGLEQCTDAQFGRGSNDPVTCPPGSQIGDVTVESPALPTADQRQGLLRPGLRPRPANRVQPLEAVPAARGARAAHQAAAGRGDRGTERPDQDGLQEQPGGAVHKLHAAHTRWPDRHA